MLVVLRDPTRCGRYATAGGRGLSGWRQLLLACTRVTDGHSLPLLYFVPSGNGHHPSSSASERHKQRPPPAPLPPPSEINGVTIITKTTTSRMIYARPVNCAAPLPRAGTRAAVSLRGARARVGSPLQRGPAAPAAA
ncbi:hypothetical protein MTO96_011578 [Rhipicephalus appendiculatus]